MTAPERGAPASTPRAARRIERLTGFDRMYLHDETPDWPCHFGGLAVAEGTALLDASGRPRMSEITARLERRLAHVPDLRQRVHDPGWLLGGPLWVDDDEFAIERHVHEATVEPPGGDAQLLEAAARVYASLLDRRRPLWELWFLTGLSDGRIGVLLKLHHAVADGNAVVAIMGSLFDVDPGASEAAPAPWIPAPIPRRLELLGDSVRRSLGTVARGASMLAHPVRLARGAGVIARVTQRSFGAAAPRTSLNPVVRAGRRVRILRCELAAMKDVAHAHGGKVNDVVLDLWAGGLRRLLASRGEPVAGVELITGLAVSLRSATGDRTIDNQAGTIVLPLPVGEADPGRRLDMIVRTTRTTKAAQRPAAIMGVLVALSATPLGRYLNRHQRAVNVLVTNVVGPPVPMSILGAPILDVVPIIQLIGNIAITLCAFSYAGRMSMVVTADATAFPDLDLLMEGMQREWQALEPA